MPLSNVPVKSTVNPEPGATLNIILVYSPAPKEVREWTLDMAAGSTVADALESSGLFEEFPDLKSRSLPVGVWGRRCDTAQVLQDRDQVEVYRDLRVDPKVARRERFNKQGVKRAGLFSSTRAGGKAGY